MKTLSLIILSLSLTIASSTFAYSSSEFNGIFTFQQDKNTNIERIATFNESTTFDVNSDGFVHLSFTLSNELSDAEQADVKTLDNDNKNNLNISINKNKVDIQLTG